MKKKLWNKPGFWISWAAIVGLIAIFAFGFSTDPKKVPSPLIGKPAPDFVVKQLDGNPVSYTHLTLPTTMLV